jgi:tetratricopeptide (TPR) repeat protein
MPPSPDSGSCPAGSPGAINLAWPESPTRAIIRVKRRRGLLVEAPHPASHAAPDPLPEALIMTVWQRLAAITTAAVAFAIAAPAVYAEGNGQADLDEALRVKVSADGNLRELNKVVELLESALDKGLDVENSDFAEQVLSESLLERASQLGAVVESVPEENLADQRLDRIRTLAISDLRRVLTYDSPPAEATAMLAKLLALPGGDRNEARGLLDPLIDDAATFNALPADEQASMLALRGALQTDVEKALADFARAIELAPDKTQYQLARAKFRLDHDDAEAALADLAKIVADRPDDLPAIVLQAQIQRDLKKYDDALASLAKAGELAPHSPIPPHYRGEILNEQEQYDKAIEEFTRALQIQPGFDDALIRRSQSYLMLGKIDEALTDIDAVLKDNPGMALAHGLRAQALAAKNRVPEAINEMKLLAGELPGQAEVHMQLALYYMLNDQPREAVEAYNEVLKLDAENYLALRSRGDAYLGFGEHAAAVDDFEAALKLKPEDSSLLNNFAWVLATSPDDVVRDGKRAIELATKACELTEYKASHILSTLAASYAETGDFETARKWSQQAVDMNDPEHLDQLKEELASYQANKPWREKQTLEEKPPAEDKPPADEASPGADAPAAADAAENSSPPSAEAPATPADQ